MALSDITAINWAMTPGNIVVNNAEWQTHNMMDHTSVTNTRQHATTYGSRMGGVGESGDRLGRFDVQVRRWMHLRVLCNYQGR